MSGRIAGRALGSGESHAQCLATLTLSAQVKGFSERNPGLEPVRWFFQTSHTGRGEPVCHHGRLPRHAPE